MKELISRENFNQIIDHPGSASVLLLDEQNRILLFEQQRSDYPIPTYEIPGGVIEKGETPEQTARRELEEETGYTFNLAKHLITVNPSVGYSNEWISIFAARAIHLKNESEFSCSFFSQKEVESLIHSGQIVDAQTLVAIGQWTTENLNFESPKVLFICSGNYYRSRFCEVYLNHITQSNIANSKGLLAYRGINEGLISPHTLKYLHELKLPIGIQKFPEQLEERHLQKTPHIVALCEREHRPMMKEMFSEWEDKITYWQVNDIDFSDPKEALPELKNKVEEFAKAFGLLPQV